MSAGGAENAEGLSFFKGVFEAGRAGAIVFLGTAVACSIFFSNSSNNASDIAGLTGVFFAGDGALFLGALAGVLLLDFEGDACAVFLGD
jgi:hypothetical protein